METKDDALKQLAEKLKNKQGSTVDSATSEANLGENESEINKIIEEVKPEASSVTESNTTSRAVIDDDPYDMVPLPSKGKFYLNKKSEIKVSYMLAKDEDLLTSINLIKSGNLIRELVKNKIKEEGFSYDDLLIGDRDAILIWLRASSYGSEYPIVVTTDEGNEIEYTFDLYDLKTKTNDIEPEIDVNGEVSLTLPVSKKNVKFRLWRTKDEEAFNKLNDSNKYINNLTTFRLKRLLTEVEGVRDIGYIHNFIDKSMTAGDSLAFRKFYDKIEPGIDLTVQIPDEEGRMVETTLPIDYNFFYPDFE